MSESHYKGITAKDAALGIMIGVETVFKENGFKLTVPLKETRMLMIAEEAVEQAVQTAIAHLQSQLDECRKERDEQQRIDAAMQPPGGTGDGETP
jgi:hypothetical protein